MRELARRVPAWAWLGGIVGLSAILRIALVGQMVAPFVFVDELIYAELGRSLADGAGYAVRETPVSGYSLLYPALIAPAYLLFDGLVDAYGTAKAIGAVAMSLAAVPTYFMARWVASQWLALLAALTSVAVPSMAYTGTLTTECLFYPVSLVVALVLVAYLAAPSARLLVALAVMLAVAFATRSQGLAFVPAVATAPLVLAAIRGKMPGLRRFAPLYAALAVGATAVVALQAIRGRPLNDLLGAYSVVGQGGYDVGEVLRFWLWHVEELTLYAGIVPMVVFVVLLMRSRRVPSALQAHLAATTSLTLWSTLVVGAFASRFASDRVQDRYLFFLVPLFLVALVGWVQLGARRPEPVTLIAAAGVLLLVVLFPFARFIGEPAKSDTLGLIPLWSANEHLIGGSYWETVAVVGVGLIALLLLVPSRYAIAVPIAVLAVFVVLSRPVWSGPHGFVFASKGALFQGIRSVDRDWIDQAVPNGQEVVALWTGRADRFTINQNEFFNRRVGRVLTTGSPTPGGIGESKVSMSGGHAHEQRPGVFLLPDGGIVRAAYALLDGSITPDGTVVARDVGTGMTLWRLSGPLASTTSVTGLYPNDTWSGPEVTWTRIRCRPGRLTTTVHTDPTLFPKGQKVEATTTTGATTTIAWVKADGATRIRIPVAPDASGNCVAWFTIRPTAIPADTIPGSSDDRVLGAHFDAFVYEPRQD